MVAALDPRLPSGTPTGVGRAGIARCSRGASGIGIGLRRWVHPPPCSAILRPWRAMKNGWPVGPTNDVVGAPFPARWAGLGQSLALWAGGTFPVRGGRQPLGRTNPCRGKTLGATLFLATLPVSPQVDMLIGLVSVFSFHGRGATLVFNMGWRWLRFDSMCGTPPEVRRFRRPLIRREAPRGGKARAPAQMRHPASWRGLGGPRSASFTRSSCAGRQQYFRFTTTHVHKTTDTDPHRLFK